MTGSRNIVGNPASSAAAKTHYRNRFASNRRGEHGSEGLDGHFIAAPFRFCLQCGVAYNSRQISDFGKLTALGSEGRSTATTILSLSAVRHLRASELAREAHKLLSFTDNRQDASLQAGHFNDFVEVGVLRGALYAAVEAAGSSGLRHDDLTQRVFDQLNLPVEAYSSNPDRTVPGSGQHSAGIAKRAGIPAVPRFETRVAGHLAEPGAVRPLGDPVRVARRGLHRPPTCGRTAIRPWYRHPRTCGSGSPRCSWTFCGGNSSSKWTTSNTAYQESLLQQKQPASDRPLGHRRERVAANGTRRVLFPRPAQGRDDYGGNVYLTARGGFGQYLGRRGTFPECAERLTLDDRDEII